ncbi:MAG: cyclic nucleotide-binding domain-containing protein [Proteobacteria bacterium]|nr:cyclic nucleotide-binding domain-containing protein [Pseudomonadota bacterium]
MALDTIAVRLLALEAFRGLSDERIGRLAREADRIVFRDGQKLIVADAVGDGALVIVSGRAVVVADPTRGMERREIEPGSMLGESAMLTDHRFALTVVAEGDVRAIKIRRERLLALMQDDPGLAEHFQLRLASRLQRIAIELKVIDERLAAVTQSLAGERTALAATG